MTTTDILTRREAQLRAQYMRETRALARELLRLADEAEEDGHLADPFATSRIETIRVAVALAREIRSLRHSL